MDTSQALAVKSVAQSDRLRPFYLDSTNSSRNGHVLTVHTTRLVTPFADSRRLQRKLADQGIDARVRVRRHRMSALSKARSLEGFVRPFANSDTVFDPTGSISRAKNLVQFGAFMRDRLGRKLSGLYWDARWRLIYIVLNHEAYFQDGKTTAASLAAAEETAYAQLAAAIGEDAGKFVSGLRLGFEIPNIPLVAIDELSAQRPGAPKGSLLQTRTIAAAMSALIGLGAANGLATAEESNSRAKSNAAVSAPNFDLGVLGGVRDGKGIFLAEGSATLPIGHAFGMRIDGTAGESNNAFAGGAGANLFWRDPHTGLLGVQGNYVTLRPKNGTGSEEMGRVGGIGEFYIDDFTALAAVGGQFGNSQIKDGVYGKVGLEWFATPNLMFHVNGEFDPERDGLGRFGFEWLPGFEGLPGLSVYAEAAFGDDDYERVLAGFRVHFGQTGNRTLKQRYRHDTFRHTLSTTEGLDASKGAKNNSYVY